MVQATGSVCAAIRLCGEECHENHMILHSDKRVRHEQTRKDSCKGRTETDGHFAFLS